VFLRGEVPLHIVHPSPPVGCATVAQVAPGYPGSQLLID